MDDLQKMTTHVEYLFLKKIANDLRQETIDIPTAKTLAQEFLKIEPFASVDDAKNKIQAFVGQHSTLALLQEYVDAYYYDQHKDETLEKMRGFMRNGQIDEAIQVIKQ